MKVLFKKTGVVLVSLLVILLLYFGSKNQKTNKIWDLRVELLVEAKNALISTEELKTEIQTSYPGLIGLEQDEVDINRIKTVLDNNPLIKNTNVHKTVDGIIKVKAEQRIPFLRIINEENASFLVDEIGVKMPVLLTNNPRLTLFTGRIQESLDGVTLAQLNVNPELRQQSILDEIFQLATFLESSDFWKHQVEHVYVNSEREFELVPRVGNHKILIGEAFEIANKLNRLELFYKETIGKEDWNEYAAIDLRFENQVVCKK